uniref:Putative conserved secreted protein n=1 Tax=Ixodes scapularis TaxID=6945 RepID=A0A4D5RGL1_IXOSC
MRSNPSHLVPLLHLAPAVVFIFVDASGFSTASQTLTRMSAPSRLDQALQAMQHMTPSTSASTCADLRATARILSAAEFQRRVLNGMSVMRSQQTEIMDMISTLLRARESFVVEPSQPILVDPLDTPEAIEVFDGALTDATSEALVVELTSLGDLSIKTTVRSMLAHLISDEAAAKFSMDGRKGKKVFRSLKLYKLIFGK